MHTHKETCTEFWWWWCLQVGPTLCTYVYCQAIFWCFGGGNYHHQARQCHRPKDAS